MENYSEYGQSISQNWNVYRLNRTKLVGSIINERFVVGQQIGKGSFGQVYEVKDIQNIDEPLVIKFSREFPTLHQEVKICLELTKKINQSKIKHKQSKFRIPRIVHFGNVILSVAEQGRQLYADSCLQNYQAGWYQNSDDADEPNESVLAFFIMQRFGNSLSKQLLKLNFRITTESILHLGVQLLYVLEHVHNCGYVYNDLKLDNILLGFKQSLAPLECKHGNCFQDLTLSLIDFGCSTPYLDDFNDSHLPPGKCAHFRGNMLFGSKYQLNFDRTSRRDDLFSLFNLMVFMINKGSMPGVNWERAPVTNREEQCRRMHDLRSNNDLSFWCRGNASCLMRFAQLIDELEYETSPDYKELRSLLQKEITSQRQPEVKSKKRQKIKTVSPLSPKKNSKMVQPPLITKNLKNRDTFQYRSTLQDRCTKTNKLITAAYQNYRDTDLNRKDKVQSTIQSYREESPCVKSKITTPRVQFRKQIQKGGLKSAKKTEDGKKSCSHSKKLSQPNNVKKVYTLRHPVSARASFLKQR